jgi:hypothetical protein
MITRDGTVGPMLVTSNFASSSSDWIRRYSEYAHSTLRAERQTSLDGAVRVHAHVTRSCPTGGFTDRK